VKIEHFACQVADAQAVAAWYCAHLGFEIKRATGAPTHTHFLADSSGGVMIEIYNHPDVRTPDYRAMDPLLLHIAFCSDDPAHDRDRLAAVGAIVANDLSTTPAGDRLVMMRDPWGLAIQLVRRATPML
jgi:glyoxylase I family protein